MSDRTSAEVERDVIAKRRAVEETLEALRDKLSSGQIFGTLARSFTGAGGQGGELMGNLARQVRDNPLPVALTGVGLAWLLTSQYAPRPAAPAAAEEPVEPAADIVPPATAELAHYDRDRYVADAEAHGVEHAVNALVAGHYDLPADAEPEPVSESGLDEDKMAADEREHGAAHVLKQLRAGAYRASPRKIVRAAYDRTRLLAEHEKFGAAHVGETYLASAGAAVTKARERGREVGERMSDIADNALVAGRQLHRTLDAQVRAEPLMSGVVGVALGVILGALLPFPGGDDRERKG